MTWQSAADDIRDKQGQPNSISPSIHADALESVGESFVEGANGDYSVSPNMLLTPTPTVITGWVSDEPPEDISEDIGEFTVDVGGKYFTFIERIYQNTDSNPSLIVNLTIRVEYNDGGGWSTLFTRTAPITSATANNEPAISPFGTPKILTVSAGTRFRILVSAEDNGNTPQDTRLIRAKMTAYKIRN